MTARFGRLADLVREAAFLAKRDARETVTRADVRLAIRRTKGRADLPSRRFLGLVQDDMIRIATHGSKVASSRRGVRSISA